VKSRETSPLLFFNILVAVRMAVLNTNQFFPSPRPTSGNFDVGNALRHMLQLQNVNCTACLSTPIQFALPPSAKRWCHKRIIASVRPLHLYYRACRFFNVVFFFFQCRVIYFQDKIDLNQPVYCLSLIIQHRIWPTGINDIIFRFRGVSRDGPLILFRDEDNTLFRQVLRFLLN